MSRVCRCAPLAIVVSFTLLHASCAPTTTVSQTATDNASLPAKTLDVRNPEESPEKKMTAQKPSESDPWLRERLDMVEHQIRRRGIQDEGVLAAMTRIPRHLFVPQDLQSEAYYDGPLPIGYEQTISQPYIVALMTELVRPQPGDRALEIGTGCGYQAAVLSELVQQVYSIEIIEPLANQARSRLKQFGHDNIEVRLGDGYLGWAQHAPFQIIIVAAAPDHVPQPLLDQLAPGGRMVIPVGRSSQDLLLIEKSMDGNIHRSNVTAVAFVPMTGVAENQ